MLSCQSSHKSAEQAQRQPAATAVGSRVQPPRPPSAQRIPNGPGTHSLPPGRDGGTSSLAFDGEGGPAAAAASSLALEGGSTGIGASETLDEAGGSSETKDGATDSSETLHEAGGSSETLLADGSGGTGAIGVGTTPPSSIAPDEAEAAAATAVAGAAAAVAAAGDSAAPALDASGAVADTDAASSGKQQRARASACSAAFSVQCACSTPCALSSSRSLGAVRDMAFFTLIRAGTGGAGADGWAEAETAVHEPLPLLPAPEHAPAGAGAGG